MIKQCKGKDLSKVPMSKLEYDNWSFAIKYDGNYIQIRKIGNSVRFFTSNAKEFYIKNIADFLIINNDHDFDLECEYIADTDGKLGSRKYCSTGTFRANFRKGIETNTDNKFMVFNTFGVDVKLPDNMPLIEWSNTNYSLEKCKELAVEYASDDYEGLMLKHISFEYKPGKRVNNLIKLKARETADLRCISITPGNDGFEGKIGSLNLYCEDLDVVVSVSSGLNIEDREVDPSTYINKIIEISYEQILDTYVQPVFIGIRNDKE